MTRTVIIYIIGIVFSLVLSGCKKSDHIDPAIETQNLSFNIKSVVDDEQMNFSSVFTTESGQNYTLSMFRYYLSNVVLVKNDGSEYRVKDKYFLVSPSVTNYDLGVVPVADYKAIKFAIGIDSVTNHQDPTVYPVTHPLAIQSPAIHWSWNSGYIFMMIEGSCDTTADNSDELTYGQYSHGMFFHIGMDPMYRTVELNNLSFSVNNNSPKTIKLEANINKIFTDIDLKTENASHTMGTMSLATKVADNIPSMFSVVQ